MGTAAFYSGWTLHLGDFCEDQQLSGFYPPRSFTDRTALCLSGKSRHFVAKCMGNILRGPAGLADWLRGSAGDRLHSCTFSRSGKNRLSLCCRQSGSPFGRYRTIAHHLVRVRYSSENNHLCIDRLFPAADQHSGRIPGTGK